MGGNGYTPIVFGTLLAAGCGPRTEPAAPPDPPPVAPPPDAGPAAPPAPVDAGAPPAPADPLAGKSPEERWRWAVERIPELAGVLQAPDPDFARWLDSRGRVVLQI